MNLLIFYFIIYLTISIKLSFLSVENAFFKYKKKKIEQKYKTNYNV